MSSINACVEKLCKKCVKQVNIYLTCFQCDAIYHIYCLKKVPGVYVNQQGHLFCCRNVTSKRGRTKKSSGRQHKPSEKIVGKRNLDEHNKDLENCLPGEKDLERSEVNCDARPLELANREHQESEGPDKQGELRQDLVKDKAGLVCSFCKEENFQKESYEQHIKRCEKYYSRLNTVILKKTSKAHILGKHSNAGKRYKCNDCKYSAHQKDSLLRHTRIHTNERPFKCNACDYTTIWECTLKRHILIKHSNLEKKYKCDSCKYSAYAKEKIVLHKRIHTNERPFKCESCNYTAAWSSNLKAHILVKHSDAEKRYKCNYCKYSAYRRGTLVRHMRIHSNERPFKCESCNYAALQSKDLKNHILAKHSNEEKKYKCNDCKYSANAKWKLVEHMRIHTNEKPFKCETCNYASVSHSNLKTHILIKHSNIEKRYKCNDCKYSSYAKANLARHVRIHTNKKPFRC